MEAGYTSFIMIEEVGDLDLKNVMDGFGSISRAFSNYLFSISEWE